MILVTGCARSGTSLTTAVLRACGANLGAVNSLNENMAVREGLVKPYLSSIKADPLCQDPLPDLARIAPDPEWRAKVTKAIGQPEPWAYKCAKACLFWPLWVEHFPEAKWVIVRRDRDKIVDSCLRTVFMRAFKDRSGWERWVDVHLERFEQLKAVADCIEVWPHEAVSGDTEAYRPMVEHCGLEWRPQEVSAEINPGRWHG